MNATTRQDLTAEKSTPVLVASLRSLTVKVDQARELASVTGDYEDCQALNLVRSWVVNALESRYPQAVAALEEAFEADEDSDYDAVLIGAIPAGER